MSSIANLSIQIDTLYKIAIHNLYHAFIECTNDSEGEPFSRI